MGRASAVLRRYAAPILTHSGMAAVICSIGVDRGFTAALTVGGLWLMSAGLCRAAADSAHRAAKAREASQMAKPPGAPPR
ncbi:hypothetical protein GCM10022221_67820 [Actinocorallia aurea]